MDEQEQRTDAQTVTSGVTEAGPDGALEQIRELIVQPRAQRIERALEALDRRREAEASEMRRSVDRSLERLDSFAKKEADVLGEHLSVERRERVAALQSLAEEARKQVRGIEERLGQLEETIASTARELREQMLDQFREFTNEVHRWQDGHRPSESEGSAQTH